MPYDPIRDAPAFRATLKRLADIERLTSQTIVDMFHRHRTRGDNLSISRATLDRFIQGDNITKIRELRVIHDMLHDHPAYRAYFVSAAPAPARRSPYAADDWPALLGFDAPGGAAGGAAWGAQGGTPDHMIAALPGQYVLMRRDRDPITIDRGVRVSALSLEAANGGIVIQETQSYRTPGDDVPFEQTDRGRIFTHGPNVYFLMKEVGGTAVKFGVIEQMLPDIDRSRPVQYLQGYVMVVSRRGVFPRTRFAARRYSSTQHPVTSGILPLSGIDDPRAEGHLRPDFDETANAA